MHLIYKKNLMCTPEATFQCNTHENLSERSFPSDILDKFEIGSHFVKK